MKTKTWKKDIERSAKLLEQLDAEFGPILAIVLVPGKEDADAAVDIEPAVNSSATLATDRQIEFLKDLGASIPAGLTKLEASAMIEKLTAK